jgi:hypothetical protein
MPRFLLSRTSKKPSRRPERKRNYYEHVIRDEPELNAIRAYIIQNPLKWEEDGENPLMNEKSGITPACSIPVK